jgi:GNAT superfamily N-acetyltransferase
MLTLPHAIDVVAAALALNRSIVQPAEVVRHGPLWIMRDADARPGKGRREEIFAFGAPPAEVVRAVQDYGPHGNYALEPFIALGDDTEATKRAYKSLGYRLSYSETLFVCPLRGRAPAGGAWDVRRITTLEQARRVTLEIFGKANRKLRPEDLTGARPKMRYYCVEVDGQAVAVARSLMPRSGVTWLHDVHTVPDYRRRGIATALIDHILMEDARLGSRHSVLLASEAGSKVYPGLGYQLRAILQIYNPLRKPNR